MSYDFDVNEPYDTRLSHVRRSINQPAIQRDVALQSVPFPRQVPYRAKQIEEVFRSLDNIKRIEAEYRRRFAPGPMLDYLIDTLDDAVRTWDIADDVLALRGMDSRQLNMGGELGRLNRAFIQEKMRFVREYSNEIDPNGFGRGVAPAAAEDLPYMLFMESEVRPPGLEHLNGPGPYYKLYEEQQVNEDELNPARNEARRRLVPSMITREGTPPIKDVDAAILWRAVPRQYGMALNQPDLQLGTREGFINGPTMQGRAYDDIRHAPDPRSVPTQMPATNARQARGFAAESREGFAASPNAPFPIGQPRAYDVLRGGEEKVAAMLGNPAPFRFEDVISTPLPNPLFPERGLTNENAWNDDPISIGADANASAVTGGYGARGQRVDPPRTSYAQALAANARTGRQQEVFDTNSGDLARPIAATDYDLTYGIGADIPREGFEPLPGGGQRDEGGNWRRDIPQEITTGGGSEWWHNEVVDALMTPTSYGAVDVYKSTRWNHNRVARNGFGGVPAWDIIGRLEYERDIEDTLGPGMLDSDNVVRGQDMSAFLNPNLGMNRRFFAGSDTYA